jgi:nicotinamidase-related amidase
MKALLVIDVQKGVFAWEDTQVFMGEILPGRLNGLIAAARGSGSRVVFVQHEDEWLPAESDMFALLDGLDARPGVDLFIVKHHGSAFHGTSLESDLFRMGVDELVVCGLQTEFCVDSTVRHAYALGFPVTLVADAHSTFDSQTLTASQIIGHHNRTLGDFAALTHSTARIF